MAGVKVNAEQVIASATKIKNLNDQINAEFSNVQSAITRLDGYWDGAAAENTIRKFNAIKNTYYDARYNVVDNFVEFLYQQVGEGYKQTEETNKSLADQFK